MATVTGLVLLFLFSTASVAFGYDRGWDYIARVSENPKDVAVRLAKLDLVSYLLTSVPLIGIVSRARAAEIGRMVTISTRVRKLDQLLAIAGRYYCSVGTHPHNADEEDEGDAVALCFSEPGGSPVVVNTNFNRVIEYPNTGAWR